MADDVTATRSAVLEVPRSIAWVSRPCGYAVADLEHSRIYVLDDEAGAVWSAFQERRSATIAELVRAALTRSPEVDAQVVREGIESFVETMISLGLCRARERDAPSGVPRL
jgi:hypothetical protein